MRLLIVEDDRKTADYIVKRLSEAGHACDCLADGRDGLFAATRESYDVIVADRMIPGLDGLSMVKAIRAAGVRTPILFLTSVGGVDDRVEGLEVGGDDYLVKPFAFRSCRYASTCLAAGPCTGPVNDAQGRRSRDGSACPQGDAPGSGDRVAATRIQAA